jgi:hypothetical protein
LIPGIAGNLPEPRTPAIRLDYCVSVELVCAAGEVESFLVIANFCEITRASVRRKGHITQPVDIPAGLKTLAFDVDEHRDLAELMDSHSLDGAFAALIPNTDGPILEQIVFPRANNNVVEEKIDEAVRAQV